MDANISPMFKQDGAWIVMMQSWSHHFGEREKKALDSADVPKDDS